jgi:hypothetical protein
MIPLRRFRIGKYVPAMLLVAHTAAVFYVAMLVIPAKSSEAGIVWLAFMVIDFPASLFVWVLVSVLTSVIPSSWLSTELPDIISALLFGIFGGVQYYLLGMYVRHILDRRLRSREANIDPFSVLDDT